MRRICVFLGSNAGRRAEYAEAAAAVGTTLARQGIGLVYGGASVGLMGILADAALAAGGEVIGVIPRGILEREVAHKGLADLRIVDSMHERKALMAELSDAFVALPGGAGTLEELFEVWTWAQLGSHEKPCAVLDVAGYFERLLGFVDHMVAEGFMRAEHRDMLLVAGDPESLLARLRDYRAPQVAKWIGRGER
ncbi:TIGR00730 family Rossman fold protein [Ancylobacter oerskovii]|uniref:Cytokinin riboside 5'-monophosphate phosphoribohydrolase n=1 Tax=Ancylobacter oerskovii TaxID=459519 RepID=A0ABW4Z2P7_9HYPH|nr:TIGR00730 family Rossman fold protein [Ancylobacter oerskovii]MBS7545492.1 TIGR00730 family Rossman fold protein [Ancylobacter oerskovii]